MISSSEIGYERIVEAAEFIRTRSGRPPAAVIQVGTGLEAAAASAHIETYIDYGEIPHFPISTVPTHAGRLACGEMAGRPVVILQGRFHLYEGYSARDVAFPIRVMHRLGAGVLVLTNAAGGLNPLFAAGDIMVITDHINLTGENPLAGRHDPRYGERFPDMTRAYDRRLQESARPAANASGVVLQAGVYAGLKGPSLETPAEMRWLSGAGADAVGFSTVMETIAGVQAGMRVLGLSAITNLCRPDEPLPVSVEEVVATASAAAPRMDAIITGVLAGLDNDRHGPTPGRGDRGRER